MKAEFMNNLDLKQNGFNSVKQAMGIVSKKLTLGLSLFLFPLILMDVWYN